MAIGDRVQEALQKFISSDYENAMVQIAIAIDATAKIKYSKKLRTGERFRKFIQENQEFILYVALGCGPRFIFEGDGNMKFMHRGSLAQVVYKYVRNALLHEGEVSDDIVFRHGPVIGHEGDKFIVSSELIVGMLLSVIGDQKNASQKLKTEVTLNIAGKKIPVNSIWGRLDIVKASVGFK